MSPAELAIAVATGLIAGTYAGLLGVGGGIVMVPALVIVLDQPQAVAQGTSLLVIVATAAVGTVVNARRDALDRRLAALLGAAGVVGTVVGALLALRVLDEDTLRRVFGATLLLLGLRMLVSFVRDRGPRANP